MRWALAIVLTLHVLAHVGGTLTLLRTTPLKARALLTFVLPPLAPFWLWDMRKSRWLSAWLVTFFVYAGLLLFR